MFRSAFTHLGLLGRIARAPGLQVVAPNYRLAPEHPGPAAFDDALAAFAALGLPADRVILGGDSAGGGIAAALAADLCAQAWPPLGLILLSPWTDLTLSCGSLVSNAASDPLILVDPMAEAARQICGALAPGDPRLSLLFADWSQACPTFIQVGASEVLLDDSARLAEVLRAAGAEVTLERLVGVPHVLAFLAPRVPEATAAIGQIAAFIQTLSRPPQPSDS